MEQGDINEDVRYVICVACHSIRFEINCISVYCAERHSMQIWDSEIKL